MYDVAALGELLIDFTPEGNFDVKSPIFRQNAGGAPANVLASLVRLGGSGVFIGKVGNDPFGHFLRQVMEDNGVDMSGLSYSEEAKTALAFVHLDENGDRHFSFHGLPGADKMLSPSDVDAGLIQKAKVFHFGSLSLTGDPSAQALKRALRLAKENGNIISYDPNWRPALWKNATKAREGMKFGLEFADIVKLSEDELKFLTGEKDPEQGTRILIQQGVSLVFVTQGARGCFFRSTKAAGHRSTYDTPVVDTTGCGDTFLGAALYRLTRPGVDIHTLGTDELSDIVDFAGAAGALCATKKGALPGMPSLREIDSCRKHTSRLT